LPVIFRHIMNVCVRKTDRQTDTQMDRLTERQRGDMGGHRQTKTKRDNERETS
jgi:hypothetical protein